MFVYFHASLFGAGRPSRRKCSMASFLSVRSASFVPFSALPSFASNAAAKRSSGVMICWAGVGIF